MDLFDVIRDILFTKQGKFLGSQDTTDGMSVFLTQRWISMYSSNPVEILNSSINIIYKDLDDEQQYKMMLQILPTYDLKKINYIKQPKIEKKPKSDTPDIVSIMEENITKLDKSVEFVFGKGDE